MIQGRIPSLILAFAPILLAASTAILLTSYPLGYIYPAPALDPRLYPTIRESLRELFTYLPAVEVVIVEDENYLGVLYTAGQSAHWKLMIGAALALLAVLYADWGRPTASSGSSIRLRACEPITRASGSILLFVAYTFLLVESLVAIFRIGRDWEATILLVQRYAYAVHILSGYGIIVFVMLLGCAILSLVLLCMLWLERAPRSVAIQ